MARPRTKRGRNVTSDQLWGWYTRGLLGVAGLLEKLEKEADAPDLSIREMEQARAALDRILRSQGRKREQRESNA